MFNAPKTTGEVCDILAQGMVDVMYGHMKREDYLAIVEGADKINQNLRTEITAYALQVKAGHDGTQRLGSLPINASRDSLACK